MAVQRCACILLALLVAEAAAVEVKLTVEDFANVKRAAEPVTSGVPFAKGVVTDVGKLSVRAGDKVIPAQFIPISKWPDGSVRWALMDCQVDVPAGGRIELVVKDDGANVAPAEPLGDDQHDASKEIPLVIYLPDGRRVSAGKAASVTIEQDGPLRRVVRCRGVFPGVHKGLLRWTTRFTLYAGRPIVRAHVYLENQGAYGHNHEPEWYGFDGVALDLRVELGSKLTAACEGVSGGDGFRVSQRCTPNYDWKSFAYTIEQGGKVLKTGARTDGIVRVTGGWAPMTLGIRHFWQNYPKAIELDGKTIRFWLWPRDGEWPRPTVRGGWKNPKFAPEYRKRGMYHLPGGCHKGHEIIVDLSGRDPKATAATLNFPLMARATPEYYASTEAAPGWFAPAAFRTGRAAYDKNLAYWNQRATNGIADRTNPRSLYYARQGGADGRGYWYGIMDFGDNYWACGPSSLHYDWTWMMLLNYLRSGDRGFLDIGTTMARHRSEVDQMWSDRDSAAYRAVCRYEKGYTGTHFGTFEHGTGRPTTTHTWLSGIVLYYMLTGEEKAREAALRTHQGILLRAVNPQKKSGPRTSPQPRSSGWATLALCSLYDLTGEKKYLDEAMVLFNNHFVPLWTQSGCYWGGGLQYYYCTQGLVELHQRTGDPRILKLLREGCEQIETFKSRYSEWHIFLSNVFAYVGHVENNEAYLRKAEALFNQDIPDDPNPPCYIRGGQAWTKETGKILRNGHILQYVNWKRAKR